MCELPRIKPDPIKAPVLSHVEHHNCRTSSLSMKAIITAISLVWIFPNHGVVTGFLEPSRNTPTTQRMATSSSDLKQQKQRTFPKDSVVSRLKQAVERAKLAKEESASIFSIHPIPKPNDEATLTQLMGAIDEHLIESSMMRLNRPSHPARDSMTALMMHNDKTSIPSSCVVRTVAIVLCKPLMDGIISLEQTVRIQRLVTAMNDGTLEQPYKIIFVGSNSSEASMEYFQTISSPNDIKCMAESTSIPDGGLDIICDILQDDLECVSERLKHRHIMFHMHFALVSSDYHLCVLNDIHVRSPGQSYLQRLEQWGVEQSGPSFRPPTIATSWTYLYASTVDLKYNDDENLAFVSTCYRRAQQLIPVLMNLRAVCANREFFQRDNYRVLVQVRRSFITDIERLYCDSTAFARVRRHLTPTGKPLDIVLEEALLSMGRCSDLVRPAGMLTGSVLAHDFHLSVTVLEHAISLITVACDPDQPMND